MGILEDIKDIITLSKDTGMTLSEVKELMEMAKTSSNDKEPKKDDEKREPEKESGTDEGKQEPSHLTQNDEPTPSDDNVVDYKAKVEELEEKIKNLQKENINKDNSNKEGPSDIDMINELTRSFM